MSSPSDSQLPFFDAGQPIGTQLTTTRLNNWIRYCLASTVRPGGRNTEVRRTSGGTTVSSFASGGGGSTVADFPFEIILGTDDADLPQVKLYPGTINGLLPTNIFAQLPINGVGTEYIILTCQSTNGHVTTATSSVIASPPPAPTVSLATLPVELKILIGVLVDGIPFQIQSKNLVATGQEMFRVTQASPTPGSLGYDSYFTWVVRGV